MLMRKDRILWADDEIDLLRAYVLFLEEKGYEVVTANQWERCGGTLSERIVRHHFSRRKHARTQRTGNPGANQRH